MGSSAEGRLIDIGDTLLYCHLRGAGPSVVLVPGASGDGGYFEPLAKALASDFTVVTYDRRGNSRSPRPDGWTETSNQEQARDLAGLVSTLAVAPAVVVGNSGGSINALSAILDHEELFRGALLHEPPLLSVLQRPEEVLGVLQPIIDGAMAEGGPRAAMEAFVGFAAGDSIRPLAQSVVERMLGNAEVFFGLEFGRFESWRPDEERLRKLSIPVHLLLGEESPPFYGEASSWLAERVGGRIIRTPGGHVGMIDRPDEFAAVIRPLIQAMG